MKIKNVTVRTFFVIWKRSAKDENGKHDPKMHEAFKKAFVHLLHKKYFAAVYDEKGNLHYCIFDTEQERFAYLVNYFENGVNDRDSGKSTDEEFIEFATDDIDSLFCYKPINNTCGVEFTL